MRTFYVYILANSARCIYVGVTNNIYARLIQHRDLQVRSTALLKTTRLVFVETTNDIRVAIAREKQIKAWRRSKKLALIETMNPSWEELLPEWRED